MTATPPAAPNRQIARAAATVMVAIVFGQLVGLLRGILAAQAFPAAELDAFYYANRVSETLFTLIAAGALGSAFLPTFTGFLVRNEIDAAWNLAAALAKLVTLTLSLLATLAAVFAPQIVRYALAPGLSANPGLFQLTVDLLRIQLASAVLFGLGGLMVGILNAHQVFFIPQLTAAMYQIGQIFGILILARWWGIYGLAWGVVIGAGLYLIVQLPAMRRLTIDHRPRTAANFPSSIVGLNNPAVRQVLSLMLPRVFGAGIVQLNFWINAQLASQMVLGSMTSLSYGFALMLMAQAAIAQSVAIAAMPTFSAQLALGKTDEMRRALASALRGVLFFALPASVGLVILALPVVTMLYQGGEFDAVIAEMTAWALAWYAAGMVGHALMEVLTRAFYAQQDTKTPVVIGAVAMGLNVAFSFTFPELFRQIGWMPHGGLALANSLATALEAAALFIVMRKRLGGLEGPTLLDGAVRAGAAALGMAIGLLFWIQATGSLSPWLAGLGGVAAGGVVYGLGVLALKVPEVQGMFGILKRRLGR